MSLLLYPLLFWLYPPLALFQANLGQVPFDELLLPLAAATAASMLFFGFFRLFRPPAVAAFLSSMVGVIFGFFGHLVLVSTNFLIPYTESVTGELKLHYDLIELYSFFAVVLVAAAAKACTRVGTGVSKTVACFGLVLFIQPVVKIGFSLQPLITSDKRIVAGSTGRSTLKNAPDVFYLMPDGYSRADVYQKFYNLDLTPFETQLKTLGFQIASRSTSNYFWTFLSLSSALNMRYVNDLASSARSSTDKSVGYEMILDSAVSRMLKEQGYQYIHLASTFPATARNAYADQVIGCRSGFFASDFYRVLVETTWLVIFESYVTGGLANCHLATLENLKAVAKKPGPKFVFSHLLLPHHPYLFDRHGKILSEATVSNQFDFQNRLWAERQPYADQTAFLNNQLLDVVRGILANETREAIIIIHSDHGALLQIDEGEKGIQKDLVPGDEAAIRFANFTAVRFPPSIAVSVPQDVTSANLLRVVLSSFLPIDVSPLPIRHFQSGFLTPYAFTEIPQEFLEARWQNWSKAGIAGIAGIDSVDAPKQELHETH